MGGEQEVECEGGGGVGGARKSDCVTITKTTWVCLGGGEEEWGRGGGARVGGGGSVGEEGGALKRVMVRLECTILSGSIDTSYYF